MGRRARKTKPKKNKKENTQSISFEQAIANYSSQISNKTSATIKNLQSLLKPFEPTQCASYFSGLTLNSSLHANTLRLEALANYSLAFCNGSKKITLPEANKIFKSLNGTQFQLNEDPAEDLMVSSVHYENTTFKILQGIWEANAFTLQHFLTILEHMPENGDYKSLKAVVKGVLSISNKIIDNVNLPRYFKGGEFPAKELTKTELIDEGRNLESLVSVPLSKISQELLTNPLFDSLILKGTSWNELTEYLAGSSIIERKPFIKTDKEIIAICPTSIGFALRTIIINWCIESKQIKNLELGLIQIYCEHFSKQVNLFGKLLNAPFYPILSEAKNVCAANCLLSLDPRRYIHIILIFDDFSNYDSNSIESMSLNPDKHSEVIQNHIDNTYKEFKDKNNATKGIVLIVGCSWGRKTIITRPKATSNLYAEFITAADFEILSQMNGISPEKFWLFVEAMQKVENEGVNLYNVNGFLNLFAWAKENNWHIIPHEQIPEDTSPKSLPNLQLIIDQNVLFSAKTNVMYQNDFHFINAPDGKSHFIRKFISDAYFQENDLQEAYASISDLRNQNLTGIICNKHNKWWIKAVNTKRNDRHFIYEIWQGLLSWVDRVAKELECELKSFSGDIIWTWDIDVSEEHQTPPSKTPCFDELNSMYQLKHQSNATSIKIHTSFSWNFINGFSQETNDAERSMIHSLITGIFNALEVDDQNGTKRLIILNKIFDGMGAKHIHQFVANEYRDFVCESFSDYVTIDEIAYATNRIGLGWKVRDKEKPNKITDKKECTSFLNKIVDHIWKELKKILSQFDKNETIHKLLQNYESLENEMLRWNRTVKANIELRKNKDAAHEVVSKQLGIKRGATLASRLAIEIALCECQSSAKIIPGPLDIIQIITLTKMLHDVGGWSDSIQYEVTDSHIVIPATGDILFDHTFFDHVINPYGYSLQKTFTNQNIDNHYKLFQVAELSAISSNFLPKEFIDAWLSEYNFPIDDCRILIDKIEDLGIEQNKPIITLTIKEIKDHAEKLNISKTIDQILSSLISKERINWDKPPKGYSMKDIEPWSFRRRLSLISRPIIKINDKLIISPALLREGFTYLVRNAFEAGFDEEFYKSNEMIAWIGSQRNKIGHQFNKTVSDKFGELGWISKSDINVSEIMGKSDKNNLGDIDVLAWDTTTNTVLLIECKDLLFAKTISEIAKQISEFKGELNSNGKKDRLLKHLARRDEITLNPQALGRYCKMADIRNIKTLLVFNNIAPIAFSNFHSQHDISVHMFNQLNETCNILSNED